jgi:hypothetical protein
MPSLRKRVYNIKCRRRLHRTPHVLWRLNSSGNFAMLTAIRLASSLVNNFAEHGQKRQPIGKEWVSFWNHDAAMSKGRWLHRQSQLGPARPTSAVVSGPRTGRTLGGRATLGRLPAAMRCLSLLLMTAAPLHALAKDERPVPPMPIDARRATARDHARALSEMADTAARDSARCQSSGAALGSQAYKECRALLESKMSIEKNVPHDRGYTGRLRN